MEFSRIFLFGFIVLCWVSVATTQNVRISTPEHSVTAPLKDVVAFFARLGCRLPPKLQAIVDDEKTTSAPNTTT